MSENENAESIEENDSPEVVAHSVPADDELAAPGWCGINSVA